MTPATTLLTGAILGGGDSTRMGADKATLEIAGKPMAQWVSEAMLAANPAAAGSAAEPDIAEPDTVRIERTVLLGSESVAGIPAIPDNAPGRGPLAAIADALDQLGDLFVCPCDVPTLPPEIISQIAAVASCTQRPIVLAFSDRLEPLIGVFRAAAAEPLRAAFNDGARGPMEALVDRQAVKYATVGVDVDLVRNVNEPADLVSASAAMSQV